MYNRKWKIGSLQSSPPRDILHRSYIGITHSPLKKECHRYPAVLESFINHKSLKKLKQLGTTYLLSGLPEHVSSEVGSPITEAITCIYFNHSDIPQWVTTHRKNTLLPIYDILLVIYLWKTWIIRHQTTSLGCGSVLWIFAPWRNFTEQRPNLGYPWEFQNKGSVHFINRATD